MTNILTLLGKLATAIWLQKLKLQMCNPQLGPRPTALLWTRQSKQEWNVRVKSISSTLSCTLIQRMLLCLPLVAGWSSSSDLLLTAGRWPVGKMVESYAFDFENFLFDALLCFSSKWHINFCLVQKGKTQKVHEIPSLVHITPSETKYFWIFWMLWMLKV